MKTDYKRFAFDIPLSMHRKLKEMAFELSEHLSRNVTMRELVLTYIKKGISEYEAKKEKGKQESV